MHVCVRDRDKGKETENAACVLVPVYAKGSLMSPGRGVPCHSELPHVSLRNQTQVLQKDSKIVQPLLSLQPQPFIIFKN